MKTKTTLEEIVECMKGTAEIKNIREAIDDLVDRKILAQDENGIGFNFQFSEWDKKKR